MEKVSRRARATGCCSVTLALCLAMGVPGVAAAQQQNPLEEAKQRLKRGMELYDENNFRASLVELQRAYELAPSYRLLYNIDQVHPDVETIILSARTGEGVEAWRGWLERAASPREVAV